MPRTPQLHDFSTATLSDAMDRLGQAGTLLGIASLKAGQRMHGRAFTVRYRPADTPAGTVGDYIDDVPAGSVVVLDNGGRTDCTVWGDILTAVAHARGVHGVVIDGVCRDTDRAEQIGFPIYSRGRFMRTGKDRVEVAEVGGPVTVGQASVHPGQLLVADGDGVVAIPSDVERQVLELAIQIHEREEAIVREALEGGSLRQARERHGYHLLQRVQDRA